MTFVTRSKSGLWNSHYRNAFLVYASLFFVLTFPYWLKGEVVAPYIEAAEIGASEIGSNAHIQSTKFSDFPTSYIPEITAHLNGPRSSWLALWSNQNELGRPLYQISGFSPAYLPSWLIARVTDNPYRFITILSLGTCFLTGLFMLMLCRELRLSPLAGLLAAGSIAASPLFMYWLTFPMFPATWCWSVGLMYGAARLARKHDLLGWSLLAFSAYSLLMTGYPQPVVFNAYIMAGFGANLAYRYWQSTGWPSTARYLLTAASAVVAGGVLALPSYLDLAHIAAESIRLSADRSFFTIYLPRFDSLVTAVGFFVLGTFPEAFGNTVSLSYPLPYDGLSVTPLVIFLALVGGSLTWRKTWGWWLAIGVICAFVLIPPLYLFGVRYLGFRLSPINPMGIMILPVTIISAFGADALTQRLQEENRYSRAVMFATACTGVGLLISVGFGLTQGFEIMWWSVLIALVVIGLLVAQIDRTRPALLVAALIVVGAYIAFPLMLRQDPAQISITSPLVEKVRANLRAGSRYAVVSPGLAVLPPNLNARLGLASVHSYNSLASKRYHMLMTDLGFDIRGFGPVSSVQTDFGGAIFWMSDISLILSPTKLTHGNLNYLEEIGGVHLYRVLSRMGCCLEISPPPHNITPDDAQIADPRNLVANQPKKTLDLGDRIELDGLSGQASLLVLSQKYHRDWQAKAFLRSGWTDVETVPVNGVFQGVLLPTGAQKAKLQFLPFVRFAWIAHVFWLLVLVVLVFQALRTRVSPPLANEGVPAK